jgi:hypothetical protein
VRSLKLGSASALATPGDIRIITERAERAPSPHGDGRIICSEPSPDISKALSTALQLSAAAKAPSGVTPVQGSLGYNTAQAAAELAGRTASVVALRDGLYRACEAYANGIIGRDAYGLILAHYGDLLTTLLLGEAASSQGLYGARAKIETSPGSPAPPPKYPSGEQSDGAGAIGKTGQAPQMSLAEVDSSFQDAAAVARLWPAAVVGAVRQKVDPKRSEGAADATSEAAASDAPAPVDDQSGVTPAAAVLGIYTIHEQKEAAVFRLLTSRWVVCVMEAERARDESRSTLGPFFDDLCKDVGAGMRSLDRAAYAPMR